MFWRNIEENGLRQWVEEMQDMGEMGRMEQVRVDFTEAPGPEMQTGDLRDVAALLITTEKGRFVITTLENGELVVYSDGPMRVRVKTPDKPVIVV